MDRCRRGILFLTCISIFLVIVYHTIFCMNVHKIESYKEKVSSLTMDNITLKKELLMKDIVLLNLPEDIGLDSDIFYYYKAHINKIYDGDTASSIDIDLGFGVTLSDQYIRFYGIDTPELRGEEREDGLRVAQFVKDRLEGKDVILKSYKDKKGKYGRWLGEIFIDGVNIGWELLDKGMAKPYGE